MVDFALTDDDDLAFVDGGFVLVTDVVDLAVQRLRMRLGLVLGEWFTDTRKGVPYFEAILVKDPDADQLQSIFKAAILDDDDVSSVAKLELNLQDNRQLDVSFIATIGEADPQLVEFSL